MGDEAGAWDALEGELSRWRSVGLTATLWWRDDDAVRPTRALERLMNLSARYRAPVTVAVIPRDADPALAGALAPRCMLVQHGFGHVNHAPAGEKFAEFGDHRPLAAMGRELARGRGRLERLLGGVFEPVFVPPWNRLSRALPQALSGFGFCGLSTFAPRPRAEPAPGLRQVNCHVDPIDWRHDAAFRGPGWVLGRLTEHLAARRRGEVDPDEPTGLLTHHLRHDESLWAFLGVLGEFLAAPGSAARWLDTREAFAS